MPFEINPGDPAIRFGFYLRPSYAISRAQAEMHDLLKRQFGLVCGGVFMPHATIKGFFRSDADIETIAAVFDSALSGTSSFTVFNAGAESLDRYGIALNVNVNGDGDGHPNSVLLGVHTAAFNGILPFVRTDCDFTFHEGALDQFFAHLTLAMADLPGFAFDEILEFVKVGRPFGESEFSARHFHLYAFRSDAWHGRWWDSLAWHLLRTWTLPDSPEIQRTTVGAGCTAQVNH